MIGRKLLLKGRRPVNIPECLRVGLFVLLSSLTGILAGCAHEEVVVVEKQRPVSIRTVTMLGVMNPVADTYKEICDEFMAENDYVTIIDESRMSDETWKTSVVADFCAGNEPDVLQFFTDATANQLIAMDKFVTIDEIRAEYPEYAKDTYDWALSQVANLDGVKRAVPTTGFWEGLYCNADIFSEYNVSLPTDWNSFEIAIRKFREVGIVPVACSITNVPHYWMEHFLLSSLGTQEYVKPFSKVNSEWEEGLKKLAYLRKIGAFPDDTDTIDNAYASDLFINKKAAMILEGNWFFSSIQDTDHTVVVPFPGMWGASRERVIIGGMTSGFYISRRAWDNPDKRDAVVRFVMAITSAEAVEKYWKSGGGITTTATNITGEPEYTPLGESSRAYVSRAENVVLSTDSRMEPSAYQELIEGMLDVSNGGSATELLEKVLQLNVSQ